MSDGVRFDSTMLVRCPAEVSRAVVVAAIKKQQKPAEWLRQAIRAGLQADGINPRHESAEAIITQGQAS